MVGRRAVTSIVAQPSTMLMATLCMIILMTIAVLVVLDDVLFGPIGIGSLAIGIASLGFFWLAAGYDERSPWTVKQESDPQRDRKDAHVPDVPLTILWFRVVLYGAFIFLGGYALSQTGDAIAGQTGITRGGVDRKTVASGKSAPIQVDSGRRRIMK